MTTAVLPTYRIARYAGGKDVTTQREPWDSCDLDDHWHYYAGGAHSTRLLLDVRRTPEGRWQIRDGEDVDALPGWLWEREFLTPDGTFVAYLEQRDRQMSEAVCYCGTGRTCE